MVLTRSYARQQALNRPPSVNDFQERGSDLLSEQNEGTEATTSQINTPINPVRQKGVGQRKTVIPKKTTFFSWIPDTLLRRLRRNTVGGREGEKVFPSITRASTSSSDRVESIEKEKASLETAKQPTLKFGKQMANFPGVNKLRRTPPPSPKLAPQRSGRSPSPAVSEEIVQTLTTGSHELPVVIPPEINPAEEMNSLNGQETGPPTFLWYDRGGMLRPYLPASNRQGQVGRPIISGEEKQRQEWVRWISWIWEARRQGVEAQLPAIINNCKTNLDPGVRKYDIALSRMIFRAVTAEAVKRMPTEQEMTYGIREGFILAMQLGDTKQMPLEVRDLHQKEGDKRISPVLKVGAEGGAVSSREFSIDPLANREEPPRKELHQLRLERVTPMPRQSRYFTPEQSENESETRIISRQVTKLPRDIPKDPIQELQKKVLKVVQEGNLISESKEGGKLTQKTLDQVEKQYGEKKIKPSIARGQDPSPSPSSSSTSADERRRRARREKEKEKDKAKRREVRKRRKRAPDGDDEPSDSSGGSSDDSDIGNKKYGKNYAESSSEESERSERATRQQ